MSKCKLCGKEAKKSYCSSACRQKAYRLKQYGITPEEFQKIKETLKPDKIFFSDGALIIEGAWQNNLQQHNKNRDQNAKITHSSLGGVRSDDMRTCYFSPKTETKMKIQNLESLPRPRRKYRRKFAVEILSSQDIDFFIKHAFKFYEAYNNHRFTTNVVERSIAIEGKEPEKVLREVVDVIKNRKTPSEFKGGSDKKCMLTTVASQGERGILLSPPMT